MRLLVAFGILLIAGCHATQSDSPRFACIDASACCKVCTTGIACGSSCISSTSTCHTAAGCACSAADVCSDAGTTTDTGTHTCDQDGDGFCIFDGDCNNQDPTVHPDAPEVCDGFDNNCDGDIDEGVTTNFYVDHDGDGYGTGMATEACEAPRGYVTDMTDCDDIEYNTNPGHSEVCGDGLDNNCDGKIDENC